MTIDKARRVLMDDDAGFSRWVEAAAVLTSSDESSLEDLLMCLDRRGVPAEIGATALYVRTERSREGEGVSYLITEKQDWENYLKRSQLI